MPTIIHIITTITTPRTSRNIEYFNDLFILFVTTLRIK